MNKREDIAGFYNRIKHQHLERLSPDNPHINIFERASCIGIIPYSRRDYYKVTLILGKGRLEYADRSLYIDRPALMFQPNGTLPLAAGR